MKATSLYRKEDDTDLRHASPSARKRYHWFRSTLRSVLAAAGGEAACKHQPSNYQTMPRLHPQQASEPALATPAALGPTAEGTLSSTLEPGLLAPFELVRLLHRLRCVTRQRDSDAARRLGIVARGLALLLTACFSGALAQNAASVPAGALSPQPVAQPAQSPRAAPNSEISPRQAREADDAYLQGAKEFARKDLVAAQRSFGRAVQLSPGNRDYSLALLVAREDHLTQLVRDAVQARRSGDSARADALLTEARAIDPENPIVAEHFAASPSKAAPAPDLRVAAQASTIDPLKFPAQDIASLLSGPIEWDPAKGTQSFHLRGDAQTLARGVYTAFGIQTTFDSSVPAGRALALNLDNVDFATATRVLQDLAHIFAVPVQPKSALVASDTQENRDRLMPQVEETIYLPGVAGNEMSELANVARNIFDIRQVTASATGGDILVRGDEKTLKLLNATYADMLESGSDVLFDVNLYEIDRTHINNIGATLPRSANLFSITNEAQNLVNANQSTINEVLASGEITLTGNATENILLEALYLITYAGVTDANLSNLLATVGTLDGIPLAGLSLSSTSTFNLLLNSSDVRTLDAMQLRSGNGQEAEFKAGSRYPIITATYSSGTSSLLTSAEQALLAQYTGTTSTAVTIPQFQFEDLGIDLKLTPHVLHGNDISLKLEMKIEALGGSSIDNIPVLNSRTLASVITVPAGKTAMLAALVDTNELGSIDGLPGLSELPGFQGTDREIEHDSDELLITITPHIVREGAMHIASRRLAMARPVAPGEAEPEPEPEAVPAPRTGGNGIFNGPTNGPPAAGPNGPSTPPVNLPNGNPTNGPVNSVPNSLPSPP